VENEYVMLHAHSARYNVKVMPVFVPRCIASGPLLAGMFQVIASVCVLAVRSHRFPCTRDDCAGLFRLRFTRHISRRQIIRHQGVGHHVVFLQMDHA
jgi:hypothetical protein